MSRRVTEASLAGCERVFELMEVPPEIVAKAKRTMEQLEISALIVVGADHDAVGPAEIVDRGALAQKFGIGDNGEFQIRVCLANDALNFVACAHRNGGLRHNNRTRINCARQFFGCGIDIAQVRMAIAAA